MNCYFLVPANDDGYFLEDPEFFETKGEAEKAMVEFVKNHPEYADNYVIFECREIPVAPKLRGRRDLAEEV